MCGEVIRLLLEVAGYGNGRGQRSKRNDSQWLHVLGYSRKTGR